VVLGVCLFTLCVPASAAATPATPGFLAAWKKSDGLYARWDVKAAERELDPLLAQASTLDGHERVWFDLSAARLLGMVGRYDEARAFVADSQAIVGTPVCPPDATSSWDCVLSTGYVRWAHPVSDRCINGRPQRDMGGSLFGKTGGTPEFEDSTILAAADFKPWRFWNMAVDAPAHIGSTLPVVEGFNGVVDSYFGGVQTFPYKGIVPEHKAIWCDILLARLSGGPTGPWSGTSRYTVLISTRERIVRKRSVRPAARRRQEARLLHRCERRRRRPPRYTHQGRQQPSLKLSAVTRGVARGRQQAEWMRCRVVVCDRNGPAVADEPSEHAPGGPRVDLQVAGERAAADGTGGQQLKHPQCPGDRVQRSAVSEATVGFPPCSPAWTTPPRRAVTSTNGKRRPRDYRRVASSAAIRAFAPRAWIQASTSKSAIRNVGSQPCAAGSRSASASRYARWR
jgi:hypothetical protein